MNSSHPQETASAETGLDCLDHFHLGLWGLLSFSFFLLLGSHSLLEQLGCLVDVLSVGKEAKLEWIETVAPPLEFVAFPI